MIDSIKYKINYLVRYLYFKFSKKPVVLNTASTIDFIIKNKYSISIFGDGEFDLILNNRSLVFQKNSEKIRIKLIEILQNNHDNLCVCIPFTIINMSHLEKKSLYFWKLYFNRNYRKLKKYLNFNNYYYDSLFTRLYIDYNDKSNSNIFFKKVFEIWNYKNIIVIEGETSKLGVGNDIFTNTKSLKRIICPSSDAFDKYDLILSETINHAKKDDLILISLGPTATVLSYDLSKKGYWAMDIGHIDIEYEWMKAGVSEKSSIKNRKVWEATICNEDDETEDINYKQSIISKI